MAKEFKDLPESKEIERIILEDIANELRALPDGLYDASQLSNTISKSFDSERSMCQFIEDNIVDLTAELGFEYKSHVRECAIFPWKKRTKGTKRIDFIIQTEIGIIAIEVKDPTYKSEHCSAIGQILSYIYLFEQQNKRIEHFYLISSTLDLHVTEVIDRFNLPISYVVMDKLKMITWVDQKKT